MKFNGFGTRVTIDGVDHCDYGNPPNCIKCEYHDACKEVSTPFKQPEPTLTINSKTEYYATQPIQSRSYYRLRQLLLYFSEDFMALKLVSAIIKLSDQGVKINTQSIADATKMTRQSISFNLQRIENNHPELKMFLKLVKTKEVTPYQGTSNDA